MGKKSKISNPHKANESSKLQTPTSSSSSNQYHPVFCFKHLNKDYHLDSCTNEEKRQLIEQLVKLSTINWQTIHEAGRHGMGYEKIYFSKCPKVKNKSDILKNVLLTEDVEHLLAFRFDGLKVFVGHRSTFIFHLIFIDRDFTLYDH